MIYRSSDHPGLRYSGIYSLSNLLYIYTVKLVYSNHWREFWKRSYKTGSLYIEVIIFAPKIPREGFSLNFTHKRGKYLKIILAHFFLFHCTLSMHLSSTRTGLKVDADNIPELGGFLRILSQDFGSKYNNLYIKTPCLIFRLLWVKFREKQKNNYIIKSSISLIKWSTFFNSYCFLNCYRNYN
jgi:hypothetical protein